MNLVTSRKTIAGLARPIESCESNNHIICDEPWPIRRNRSKLCEKIASCKGALRQHIFGSRYFGIRPDMIYTMSCERTPDSCLTE